MRHGKSPSPWMGKSFFDHDYTASVMEKRKECMPIKKILKEKGIRFRTPLTKMRVFLDSGTVTYESADQAVEDLQAKGFLVPPRAGSVLGDMVRLSSGWEIVRSTWRSKKYQQSIWDKRREFRRVNGTDAE